MIVQIVQVNQPFLKQRYLPYVAGLLQAYVQRHAPAASAYTFLPPLFQRLPLELAERETQMAEVLGFSVYTWNIEYALTLAQGIKRRFPERLIVFGGPQVPDRAEDFLRAHPWVDIAVHGEGEQSFLEILEARRQGRELTGVQGISFLSQGQFFHEPQRPRQRDLEQIPSPYLMGIYAPLLRENPGQEWIALWETNRGCPFSCAFCDWGSATASRVNRFGMERLRAEIDWFAQQGIQGIYCCDANFGILSRDLELTEYLLKQYRRWGAPRSFYTQNTKNATERAYQIQSAISGAGLNHAIALSLQSVTPEVLTEIERENISLDFYRELQTRFREKGLETYTDMLIGLPGDSFESFAAGVHQVIEEGQFHIIRFHNTYLLPNAEMAQPHYRKKHRLQTVRIPNTEPFAPREDIVTEYHEVVIANADLSPADWRQCRILAWWAEFLFFNRRLVQMPLVLIKELCELSYDQIFAYFLKGQWGGTPQAFPILSDIRRFLEARAQAIQAGQPEYTVAQVAGLGEVWLSPDEYLIEGLTRTQAWPAFFAEMDGLLQAYLGQLGASQWWPVIQEALLLNQHIASALLYQSDVEMPVSSNFWDIYQAALVGKKWTWEQRADVLYRDWSGRPFHILKSRSKLRGTLG